MPHLDSVRVLLPLLLFLAHTLAVGGETAPYFTGEKRLNNLVSILLDAQTMPAQPLTFSRSRDGWVLFSLTCRGTGTVSLTLDKETVINLPVEPGRTGEAFRYVKKGKHVVEAKLDTHSQLERLTVKAIPELIHCGLGYDPQIKSYGHYDLDFLKTDILPNITTLIVPGNSLLPESVITNWHGQGKHFVAEAGVSSEAKTAEDHFKYWSGCYEKMPFIDGIIINEFIVNNPSVRPGTTPTAQQRERMRQEQQNHEVYGQAIRKLRADTRFANKMLYAYVGGSGKKLNQEMIGTNFIRTVMDSGYQIALERYLHEMSSPKGSEEALQAFVDGIADWENKEPGVRKQMVIAFGLFSMPPGTLNKLPDVDYHVWMDQQMNLVANHPALADTGGLEWWTSSLADEETVRFSGKLYRHYAIEGRTNRFTKDLLFPAHIQNPDFRQGTAGWTLHPAEEGTITNMSFPRFGRIEGRFMGLWRPPDPEHIGDTFLWMKRSAKGPNSVSQPIKNLQPGRLYSIKMFSCDYDDLVQPKAKKVEDIKSSATVLIDDVDMDAKRSFTEVYPSSPEPKIPICITYYWRVFRAKGPTAKLTISDWLNPTVPGLPPGQEQAFNFVEIQPYWE